MKIGLIVPGGVDRSARVRVIPVLLALIERLARRHQVVVIALHQEPEACEYPLLGAHVINLGLMPARTRFGRYASQLKRVISVLRSTDSRFDVLHAFWAQGPGIVAVTVGTLLRIPVVVSIGGGELVWLPEIRYGGQRGRLARTNLWMALRMANAVSAGSTYALRPLAEVRRDAVWLPLGVDPRIFRGSTRRSSKPPWRLVHVGSVNEVKDHATLLQAMRLILEARAQVELDCFGVEILGDHVQTIARELGIGNHVRFHGFRPVEDIVPFYRRAHLYVQSSLHESMGAAVLEAAAAGVPTVGTNVGVVSEMAPNAAIAVPVRDPYALAKTILEVLDHPDRRECLASSAQTFAQTYDADWTAARIEAMYRGVIRDGCSTGSSNY
jgi:glycosyltransferase involved in cell wall biosynthesis